MLQESHQVVRNQPWGVGMTEVGDHGQGVPRRGRTPETGSVFEASFSILVEVENGGKYRKKQNVPFSIECRVYVLPFWVEFPCFDIVSRTPYKPLNEEKTGSGDRVSGRRGGTIVGKEGVYSCSCIP